MGFKIGRVDKVGREKLTFLFYGGFELEGVHGDQMVVYNGDRGQTGHTGVHHVAGPVVDSGGFRRASDCGDGHKLCGDIH